MQVWNAAAGLSKVSIQLFNDHLAFIALFSLFTDLQFLYKELFFFVQFQINWGLTDKIFKKPWLKYERTNEICSFIDGELP